MKHARKFLASMCCIFWIWLVPGPSFAADDVAGLKARVESLESELAKVRTLLEQQARQTATKEEVAAIREDVEVVQSTQSEWKDYDSKVHLAGYANAGYTNGGDGNDEFGDLSFNPIFHYGYKDLLLLEAELEMEIDDGVTELALEYMTVDWFINDYMTLVSGKFLSPLGQFRQNLHPSWVNKMPAAPPGFGHDQAAPVADLGVQLRGGFNAPLVSDASLITYAVYVGNGPILELNADGDEIEAVESAGFTTDDDDEKMFGGRLGFLPIPNLEIGFSGGFGDLALAGEASRDYDVLGFDVFYRWRNLDLRGEYIRQEVDGLTSSVAPEGQEWEAWYTQASYKLLPTKFELVARYSDFNSNHADQAQEQWAFGVNYLFANQGMAKFAYEINDGASSEATNEDRFVVQLSYGF